MRKLALGIAAAATLLIETVAPASAHWRHHYWGGPGIAPGVALGLVAGTFAAAAAPFTIVPCQSFILSRNAVSIGPIATTEWRRQ